MATIHPTAVIGNGVKMDDSTEIEKEVKIGDDCVLGKKVLIEKKICYW